MKFEIRFNTHCGDMCRTVHRTFYSETLFRYAFQSLLAHIDFWKHTTNVRMLEDGRGTVTIDVFVDFWPA